MKLKTRIIAFILMLLTVFYAIPVSVFAEAAFSYKPGILRSSIPSVFKFFTKQLGFN